MFAYRRWLGAACMLLFAAGAVAESAGNSARGPDEAIRAATQDLLGIVSEARGYYDADPERYYDKVDTVIAPVVDFYSFSRGVMGRWGSKAYEQSLDAAGREEFARRVERFEEVFRDALVRTYSKGLLAFSGETIEVEPADPAEVEQGSATVVQVIHGDDGTRYTIRYKMRRDAEEGWKIRNVSLDTLNLGKVYQNQFASAASRYGGDIDKVIENWTVAPATGASP